MASANHKNLPKSRILADPGEWSRFGMFIAPNIQNKRA